MRVNRWSTPSLQGIAHAVSAAGDGDVRGPHGDVGVGEGVEHNLHGVGAGTGKLENGRPFLMDPHPNLAWGESGKGPCF